MKQTLEDDNVKGRLDEALRTQALEKISKTVRWLDANQLADKEEFQHHQKELEGVCGPLVAQLNNDGAAGGGSGAGSQPSTQCSAEEVD